jgi:hypothetical protein
MSLLHPDHALYVKQGETYGQERNNRAQQNRINENKKLTAELFVALLQCCVVIREKWWTDTVAIALLVWAVFSCPNLGAAESLFATVVHCSILFLFGKNCPNMD